MSCFLRISCLTRLKNSVSSVAPPPRALSDVRVSGMLSGKKGVVYFHVGSGSQMLKPLYDIIENSEIPITQLLPCHVNRSQELINDAEKWVR